jgi:hypothetical protein
MALRPTLRADPFAINSRWRVWGRIVGACGFLATRAMPATAPCETRLWETATALKLLLQPATLKYRNRTPGLQSITPWTL